MLQAAFHSETESEKELLFLTGLKPKPQPVSLHDMEYFQLLQFILEEHPSKLQQYDEAVTSYNMYKHTPAVNCMQFIDQHAPQYGLPNRKCVKYFAARRTIHGRTVKYSCQDLEETHNRKTVSSVVAAKVNGCVLLGRVQHFLLAGEEEIAVMSWLGVAIVMENDRMAQCAPFPTKTLPNPMIAIDRISQPLLHAMESEILWILQMPTEYLR